MSDKVDHPKHYNNIPGIECLDVVEHMSFNIGNVVKYCWRFEDKGGLEDLQKAKVYLDREIRRLSTSSKQESIPEEMLKNYNHPYRSVLGTLKGYPLGGAIGSQLYGKPTLTLEQIQREWAQYSGENC